jgi:hypothetical protein
MCLCIQSWKLVCVTLARYTWSEPCGGVGGYPQASYSQLAVVMVTTHLTPLLDTQLEPFSSVITETNNLAMVL